MPLVDERGRLFGRINIIDAAACLVLCVLVPAAYGAYMLLRPLPPRLHAIHPARLTQGAVDVLVQGEHFRPQMRAMIGNAGATFLFINPDMARLQLPATMPPGLYDVVLLDQEDELTRLPGALIIERAQP